MRDDEGLVTAARSGEPDAFGELAQRWFDRCWEVAWRILRDGDLAADVAQDTLLTAWQQLDRLDRPASFGGWVSRIARNRALDRLERERRAVPTADHDALEPGDSAVPVADPAVEFDRARQQELVWAAATALGERDSSILDLHLRHGLEPAELAEELGVTPNNAHQLLFRLRKKLGGAIRAWVVWRGGKPTCVVLRAELAAAGVTEFGRDVVRLVDAHVATCEECEQERAAVVAPAAMFSAVPLVLAPAGLRDQVMAALAAAGVPVGGEATAGPASSTEAGSGAATPSDAAEAGSGAATPSDAVEAGSGAAGAVAETDGGPMGASADDEGDDDATAPPKGQKWPVVGAAAAVLLLAMVAWLIAGWLDAPDAVEELVASPLQPLPDETDPPAPPIADPPSVDAPPAAPSDDGTSPSEPGEPTPEVAPGPAPTPDEGSGGQSGTGAPDPEEPGSQQPGSEEPNPGEPGTEEPNPEEPGREEPDPVEIQRFEVRTSGATTCPRTQAAFIVAWSTSGATTVTLAVDEQRPQEVDVSGQREPCAPRDASFTLTATGPGGTVQQTKTAAG